jgi:hypothetical protein
MMDGKDITDALQNVAACPDFVGQTYKLTERWSKCGSDAGLVEPILQFMESNQGIDYGSPGPLVQFLERFCGRGYEQKVIESIERRPTAHTVWMLHRVINCHRSVQTDPPRGHFKLTHPGGGDLAFF